MVDLSDDERRARGRERYALNREKCLASQKAYRDANADLHKERLKAWRLANADKVLASQRRWIELNRDKTRANANRYYWANRDKALEYSSKIPKEILRARRAIRRARERSAAGTATARQITWRVDMWGGKCWVCGGKYEHIDHVIPLATGGSNWPSNLRPACRRCNQRKGFKSLKEHSASLEKRLEDREELGRFV